MRKFRSDRLGIEIEIAGETNLEIKEARNCVRVSYENKKISTILPDSKVEFLYIDHIICYKGRVVAFGNIYVEAWGASRVFARDRARIVAYQGAEIQAGGRTKVRALDSSRVIATGRAEICLDDKSIGYKKTRSRVKMNRLDNRAAIFDLN